MKKVRINNEYILGINLKYENIKPLLSEYEDIGIVCFENNYSEDNFYIKFLNEPRVNKVVLIGARPTSCFGEKLIVTKELKEKYFKTCQIILFIINTDIDEDVLIPLVQLFNIANKNDIKVGIDNILGLSYECNELLETSLKALVQPDIYKRYEIVYDYICDELDKKFANNSICQFENDRCIANRKYNNRDKIMGCCYSFKFNGWQISDVKLCEHQRDGGCDVKCLGCKLFTCKYLKEHGIKFSLENMPIALAFFSKKQREILRTTFFTSKENVLNDVIKG